MADEWVEVVRRLIQAWTGYQLALLHSGHDDARERDNWFVGVLAEHVFNSQLHEDELEDWMNAILYDDFDLVLEDDSSTLFAKTLIDARRWFESDRPQLDAFLARLPSEETLREARSKSHQEAESDDEEMESEEDEDDNDEGDSGAARREPKQRTIVDEEGWTTMLHFVKNAPTTEEQKAQRKKERDNAVRNYTEQRARIVAKRKAGELDGELLTLTENQLKSNPDIYTFWNIRREVLLHLKSELDPSDSEKAEKEFDGLLSAELFLTQECIEVNPKSYATWYHRAWILEHQTAPNLERDLKLCQKALQLDPRNFHCWDHRRFVAKLAKLPGSEELEFSNELIRNNFSNYSAWHYRATLLPRLKEEQTGKPILDAETIADELKKVTNAIYTDPDDQSAWVYSRWLISLGSPKYFAEIDSSLPAVVVGAAVSSHGSTVVLSRPVTSNQLHSLVLANAPLKPISILPGPTVSSRLWFSEPQELTVLSFEGSDAFEVKEGSSYSRRDLLDIIFDFTPRASSPAIDALIQSTRELIEDDSSKPWPVYILTLCLIESSPSASHKEILTNLHRLATELDAMRKEVYLALMARQIVAETLRSRNEQGVSGLDDVLSTGELRVLYKHINSLPGAEFLAFALRHLHLRGNEFASLREFEVFPLLEGLSLEENPINNVPRVLRLRLEFLSLAATKISNVSDVAGLLDSLPSLRRFLYAESPLVESSEELRSQLQNKNIRLIPFYL